MLVKVIIDDMLNFSLLLSQYNMMAIWCWGPQQLAFMMIKNTLLMTSVLTGDKGLVARGRVFIWSAAINDTMLEADLWAEWIPQKVALISYKPLYGFTFLNDTIGSLSLWQSLSCHVKSWPTALVHYISPLTIQDTNVRIFFLNKNGYVGCKVIWFVVWMVSRYRIMLWTTS